MAARTLYAKRGWAGFSFDEVAKRAKVGKGSLYLRWKNKAQMLIEVVRFYTCSIADIDTGKIRSDLIEFAHRWFAHMESENGSLSYRLTIDAQFHPELRQALRENPYPDYVRNTRLIIRNAINRGELPTDASVALIADIVAGAISNHVRNTPEELRERIREDRDKYIESLVDTVLSGVTNTLSK